MRARYTFSIALVILSLGLGVSIAAGARAGAFVAVLIAVLHPVVLALPSAFIQAGRKLARIRRNFNLSYALWLLLFLSGLVFRTRDTQTIKDSPLDAWAAFRIVCVAVAGTLAVQSVAWDSRSIRWLVRGLPAILVIFGLLCTASVVWSANPGWTLYRSLEYLVDVAVLVRIVSGVNMAERYKDYFDWTWVLLFGLLSSVWLGAVLWPDEALEKGVGVIGIQLSGVFPSLSANGVGELGGLLGLISLARAIYSPQKAFYLLVFGGCSATLIFSQTRSALAGFLCGFAFILIGIRRFRVAALVAGLVAVLFTGASDTLWAYVLRGQDSEMFTSLSG